MAAPLDIVLHPDPRLAQACAPVGAVDEATLALARAMLDTMYAAPGRGLAAPQVGVLKRLFVMDAGWKQGAPAPRICIDPEITWTSPEQVVMEEGCLSIPGQPRRLSRPARIRMAWTGADGTRAEHALDGAEARIAQHEHDHLDGVLILDRPAAEG